MNVSYKRSFRVHIGLLQRENSGLKKHLKNFPEAWPLVNKGSQETKHLLVPGEDMAGTKPLRNSWQQGLG